MAKKKQQHSPKDDLIESLMNDVQEINDQPTQLGNKAGASLFLDEEENNDSANPLVVGLGGDESSVHEEVEGDGGLWQQIKDNSSAPPIRLSDPPVVEDEVGEDPPQEIPGKAVGHDDKTMNLQDSNGSNSRHDLKVSYDSRDFEDEDRTLAVEGFANRQHQGKGEISPKISFGTLREPRPIAAGGGSVYASGDATLVQAESLKLAQQRILELEKECEKYRQENEELASAGEIIRNRAEELTSRVFALEKEKQEIADSLQNEIMIVKGTLQYKETELGKARQKMDELEARLKSDFKKIRVRERELENRLELIKAEKAALLRAKDENILELKRKIDHIQSELDNYREKVLELNKTIDLNQEQFKRTVRALRLALSNLEVKEENIVPLKKAD